MKTGGGLTVYDYSNNPNPPALTPNLAWLPYAIAGVVVVVVALLAFTWLKGRR